jgi:hypothetical protein
MTGAKFRRSGFVVWSCLWTAGGLAGGARPCICAQAGTMERNFAQALGLSRPATLRRGLSERGPESLTPAGMDRFPFQRRMREGTSSARPAASPGSGIHCACAVPLYLDVSIAVCVASRVLLLAAGVSEPSRAPASPRLRRAGQIWRAERPRVGTGERGLNGVQGLLLARAEAHQWSPPSGHW